MATPERETTPEASKEALIAVELLAGALALTSVEITTSGSDESVDILVTAR